MYIRGKKFRWVLSFIASLFLIALQFSGATQVQAANTNFTLNGYRVNLAGGNIFSANWTGGDLGNTWEEGDWVPYTLTITHVQTNYSNLLNFPDLVLGYEFYDSVHNNVFIDLIRDVQAGTTLLDDSHGFPTSGGGPQPNTYAGAHAGQLDPAEHTWTGFNLLNLPDTQVNRKLDGTQDTAPGTATHTFKITAADLTGHGISATDDTIVIYFQAHLSRTFIWSNSLQSAYSSNGTTAAWGGYLYNTDSWSTANSFGSATEPGASGHMILETTGTGNQNVSAPVPPEPPASISGHKYLDNAPIGVITGADTGLSGWRIYLTGTLNSEPITFSLSTLTDVSGAYSFSDIDDEATYTISEAAQRETPLQTGYVQSYPDGTQVGSISIGTAGRGPFGWTITLTTTSPNANGLDFANYIATPSINIAKTYAWTSGDGSHVGDIVTYTFTVTNTGNVTLHNVIVIDNKLGAITLAATTLAPGAVTTGTANLVVTQALLDAGSQTNTATASGLPPSGPAVTDTDSQTVTFVQNPAISITKLFDWTTGNGTQVNDVGTFTYTVTNVGNVTLHGITVSDDKLGNITLSTTTLAPGASTTGTATLTVTQTLIDAGSQTNTATATGFPPSGPAVTDSASQTVHFVAGPFIDIVKTFIWTTGNGSQPGDEVTYTFTVTNIGNVTLHGITVTDDKLGAITLSATTLPPGGSTTGTATLTLTQALLDAGSQTNTATASGLPPSGPAVTDSDSQTVDFTQNPDIKIVKTFAWTTGDGSNVGDVVTYTYTVTNTGNVTLHGITVSDDKMGSIILGSTTLTPGASTTGTANLPLTQTLIDSGSQTNIATASGLPPSGPAVTDSDSKTVDFKQSPSIDIVKTFAWTSGDGSHVGDVVTYTYTVKNTGNVTLHNVTVSDTPLGTISLATTTLAPGATTTGTALLTLTQALLDTSLETNVATASGTPPSGPPVTDTDGQTVNFIQSPSLDLIKTFAWTTGDGSSIGNVVTYTFKVTNTGNVTLTNLEVNDDKLGVITMSATTLAPGASATGTATLTVTQDLINGVSQTNTAIASAIPPIGPDVTDTASQTVDFIEGPAIDLLKSFAWTTGNGAHLGDVVTYTYTVTNTGNVTLTGVTVTDNIFGPITLGVNTLVPGASTTGTATTTVTQALLDAGFQTNVAEVSGNPPSGPPVTDTDSQTVTFTQHPAIDVVKSFIWTTGHGSQVGDVATFTFTVTNTGNVTLHGITVNDNKLGPITLGVTSLTPGTSTFGTAQLTVTQALINSVFQTNTATASGLPPSGPAVTDSDSQTLIFELNPSIHIVKTFAWTTGDGSHVGDKVTYTFTVTNTGNVVLHLVTVNDTKLGPITLAATTLAPGAHTTGTATLTLTQTLLETGLESNTATATGTPPSGPNVTDTVTLSIVFLQSPSISIIKHGTLDMTVVSPDNQANPGDAIFYTFTVTNTGDLPLTDIMVFDVKISVTGGPIAYLGPGATDSTTFSGVYILTQADIDQGLVANTAFVSGNPPEGPPVTDSGSTTVRIPNTPTGVPGLSFWGALSLMLLMGITLGYFLNKRLNPRHL